MTSRAPHHVWHVDITQLPTWLGNWVPWWPFSMLQAWPFCYWYAAVLDQYTRAVVGWGLFRGQPSAKQMCAVLSRACKNEGTAPRHLISDRGAQFGAEYRRWCRRRGVKPRFGAVNQHGSIAIIERFFRTLKTEMRRLLGVVPLRMPEMQREIRLYRVGTIGIVRIRDGAG